MDREPVRLSLARALRLAGRLEEASAEVAVLRGKGWQPATVLTESALIERDRGDLDAAEKLLKTASQADPSSVEVWMNAQAFYEVQRARKKLARELDRIEPRPAA